MAVRGGSQCGYCTPGFVCSMAAEFYRAGRTQTDAEHCDGEHGANGFDLHALSGNLCRCTGYRPIRDAAFALGDPDPDDAVARRRTEAPPAARPTRITSEDAEFVRPADLAETLSLLAERPDAVLVAGSTDWGVEVNLRGVRAPLVVAVDRLPELRELTVDDEQIRLGTALTLTEIERRLDGLVPLLGEMFPQFASRLIRNGATLGGNLGTGSPIGDAPPALLALEAELVLAGPDGERTVALADYFTGYRESVRRPDELIRTVVVPRPLAAVTAFHKIAKRRFDDISSVAVGFALDVTDGVVSRAVIGLGGVAATPIRARDTEAALLGRPWTDQTVREAAAVMAREGTPLDDHRASASYRSAMLGQALLKLHAGGEIMSHLSQLPDVPADVLEVGRAIPHESAALHVTGQALYTDDLVARTKDCLHAWPVQATQAKARITRLDVEPAYAVPGVVRVLTAADVPGVNDAGVKHDEPLFPDEVRFYGHAVCWVLGETQEAARLGAAAVVLELEALPAVISVREAIAAGEFHGAQPTVSRGDLDAGVAASAHVFSGEIDFAGQEHFYLETHCALAQVDEAGQVFIQSSTQHPSETQEIVAHVLGRSSSEVTVQCLRMGGAFGGKEMQPHGFAAIAALGSILTGRPVRLRLNRTQDLTMTGKRHGFHAQWRVGFADDGTIQALEATLTADGGWSLDLSEPVLARALCHIDNAYWIPHILVNGRIARTNKTSQTAFRGFGGPQGMLVIEDILGRCAPLLGLDPAELRRRNFYRDGQTTPYGQPVRHAERISDVWTEVHETGDLDRRREEVARFNAEHPHVKRGLAITPVKFGISFNLTAFNQAGALVHVYKDGSVLINHGGTEMGQGLHTKMLQVAATTLGHPAAQGAAGADAHRQGAQHLGHRGLVGRRPQRRRGQERVRADPGPARAGRRRRPRGGRGRRPVRRRRGHRPRPRRRRDLLGGGRADGVLPAGPALRGRLLPHRGPALGLLDHAGLAVQVLRVRRGGHRGGGRRVHRRLHHPPRRHRARRRRQPLAAGRHRADRGRLRAGRGLADARGPAVGRERRPAPRPARHPGGQHLQAAQLLRDARRLPGRAARACPRGRRRLRVQGRGRAAADAGLLGPRGAAPGRRRVRPGRHQRRPGLASHPRGRLVGARRGSPGSRVGSRRAGRERAAPRPRRPRRARAHSGVRGRADRRPAPEHDMKWPT